MHSQRTNEELFETLKDEFLDPFIETMRTLQTDGPRQKANAVFFFGRTESEGLPLFDRVAGFIRSGHADFVVINGSKGERAEGGEHGEAWAGHERWIMLLQAMGVNRDQILLSRPAFHTKDENEAFLEIAKERGWKSAALAAFPHQLLRAMLGQLKSCTSGLYPMRLYTMEIWDTDWDKVVAGSQGRQMAERWIHAQTEALRLIPYWLKGDLASCREFLAYLLEREKIGR